MKDPAVLFYTSDFLTGTFTMTDDQVGKYMRLLCLQHQKGFLCEDDMLKICKTYDKDVYSKFIKEGDNYYNERMRFEANRRKKYSESRAENRKQKDEKPLIPNKKKSKNISKSYVNHMETEIETEIEIRNGIVFPFSSEKFKTLWGYWKEYKSKEQKFNYKTLLSEQAALKKLGELSNQDEIIASKIIEQSIANGWKGFYELKNDTNGKSKSTSSEQDKAEWQRVYDKHTT